MARKNKYKIRTNNGDPKYKHVLIGQFINKVMLDGKKAKAEKLVYKALEIAAKQGSEDPVKLFEAAIQNASPKMHVKSKRVGGATYQVPVEITQEKAAALSIKWIIEFSRKRKGKAFEEFLSQELVDAFNNTGSALKKKEEVHKMAESNRAFSHYR